MANIKIEPMVALLRAHYMGDHKHFNDMAAQIISAFHITSPDRANECKKWIEADRKNAKTLKPIPTSTPSVLQQVSSLVKLSDVQLTDDVRESLLQVIAEQEARERLRDKQLFPVNKLLLVGPSGCGKTMTASAIAAELDLPLLSLQLSEVVDSLMGETSKTLSSVFKQMASFRAVYLLDEIDSIAGARGQARQAADTEMNQVVCALLQMLDSRNETDSLVIGATNHPEVLDRAIMRRFEVVLRYPKPNEQMVTAAIENKVRKFYGDGFTLGPVVANISEVSIARLVALAELEIKRGVMQFDIGFNLSKFWESVEREVDRGRRV